MRLTRRPTTNTKRTRTALAAAAAAGVLSLAVTSAVAAPRLGAPPGTTTTTSPKGQDRTPPPAPVLTEKPDDPTTSRSARFAITDAEPGVTFRCSLDGAPYESCGSTAGYSNLQVGDHCFAARAADAAGNLSKATTWCWSIVLMGGFPISGEATGLLAPGVTRPVDLEIGNPYNFTIRVTEVIVTVGDTTSRPGCAGPTNLTVTRGLLVPADVPAGSTRTLSQLRIPEDRWPAVTMPNLASNQDACRSARFSLSFTGQATRP